MANLHTIARIHKIDGEQSWSDSYIEISPIIGTTSLQEGIGSFINSVQFELVNGHDKYFNQYYKGDNTTSTFTLDNFIPTSDNLPYDEKYFKVYIYNDNTDTWDIILSNHNTYGWSLNTAGTQITFNTAPPNSIEESDNIRIAYNVLVSGDLLEIYQFKNSNTYSSSDLVFVGTAKIPKVEKAVRGNIMKVRALDLLQSLFRQQIHVPARYGYAIPTNTVICEILNAAFRQDPEHRIPIQRLSDGKGWDSEIATSKSDGNSFPTHDADIMFEPVIDCLEKYSKNEFTEDGDYLFGVRDDGTGLYKFFWEKKDDDVYGVLDESNDIKKLNIQFYEDDIVNEIIINCGTDPNGNSVTTHIYNGESIAKHKPHIKSITRDYCHELMENERQENADAFTQDSDGIPYGNFPNSYAGYKMVFSDPEHSSPVTPDEYNTNIKLKARLLAREEWQPVVDDMGDPPVEIIITRSRNTTKLSLGKKYELNLYSRNLPNMDLRITKIQSNNRNYLYTFRQDFNERGLFDN